MGGWCNDVVRSVCVGGGKWCCEKCVGGGECKFVRIMWKVLVVNVGL